MTIVTASVFIVGASQAKIADGFSPVYSFLMFSCSEGDVRGNWLKLDIYGRPLFYQEL